MTEIEILQNAQRNENVIRIKHRFVGKVAERFIELRTFVPQFGGANSVENDVVLESVKIRRLFRPSGVCRYTTGSRGNINHFFEIVGNRGKFSEQTEAYGGREIEYFLKRRSHLIGHRLHRRVDSVFRK